MSHHAFCTDVCSARGEPLAGTGAAPSRILMLAWPRGKWRHPRWQSVGMSAALTATLHQASQAGLHVALVDKVEASGSLPTLHALPENIHADFFDESALITAISNYVAGILFAGHADSRPTILCCTDSRRDACCARHGFSTYKALVAVADPARFNIVQATHIGGCRFAASLVVMPQRQRYGRMSADQAAPFIAALEAGKIYLPAFKGRTDLPEPLQVAELAALHWATENGFMADDVSLEPTALPDTTTAGTTLDMTATVGPERVHIALQARQFVVQGNCSTVAAGGGTDQVRWCLMAVNGQSPHDAAATALARHRT